ncbi:methyl-CpG-binding domain-containing protein 5-like [Solanum dulcamara]|uniref:methyl-CpG-binding domain-containing protein 5-like n=1 Tax=Solanum dulcamara TaxID=45834 RepID=UPI0024860BAB|nr:methyl-CpG-binding domain-containing protein 5-like [Solanum dulcamara]
MAAKPSCLRVLRRIRRVTSPRPPLSREDSPCMRKRPSWLPENWAFQAVLRTSSVTAGFIDKFYYEPITGDKFLSNNEVHYFLEMGGKRKKVCTESSSTDCTTSEAFKSKKKKSNSKTKKVNTPFYFDSANPLESVCWTQTDSSADTWEPLINGNMISGIEKQEWDVFFTSVSKLKLSNTKKEE